MVPHSCDIVVRGNLLSSGASNNENREIKKKESGKKFLKR